MKRNNNLISNSQLTNVLIVTVFVVASLFLLQVNTVDAAMAITPTQNPWVNTVSPGTDVVNRTVYNTTVVNTTQNTGPQFYVETNSAESVTTNSARVGGFISGAQTTASGWIEYGRTNVLGAQSQALSVGNGAYRLTLTGLNAGTTYYYRAVASSGNQISRGNIFSFTTNGTVTNVTTNTSNYAKLVLSKEVASLTKPNGNTTLIAAAPGDTVRYSLVVKNTGTKEATSVVVIDQLDSNLSLVASGNNTIFDSVTRTLSWNVGTLLAGASKSMAFDAKVGPGGTVIENTATARATGLTAKTSNKTQLVVTSLLPGNIACNTSNTNSTGGNLGVAGVALAGPDSFLPTGLGGWFLTLLFLVAIGVLLYRLMSPRKTMAVH